MTKAPQPKLLVACSYCGAMATSLVAGCYSCVDHRPDTRSEPVLESPTGFDWYAANLGTITDSLSDLLWRRLLAREGASS